jgi:hypothetical protein
LSVFRKIIPVTITLCPSDPLVLKRFSMNGGQWVLSETAAPPMFGKEKTMKENHFLKGVKSHGGTQKRFP